MSGVTDIASRQPETSSQARVAAESFSRRTIVTD